MKNGYTVIRNNYGTITHLEVSKTQKDILSDPFLNKGTAFNWEDRIEFHLTGLLPSHVETLEEQARRVYLQFQTCTSHFEKFLFLYGLYNRNETLFYYLIHQHLNEIFPIIYTPTIGEVVEKFNTSFQYFRGLYLSYPYREKIAEIIQAIDKNSVDLIVVSDGERVLGLGDQGVGGMHICIAKAMLYTLFAGISPDRILPIHLDVGTNNQALLHDPFYLGWKHERIVGGPYDFFVEQVISALRGRFPSVLLHWEDFGRHHARKNLLRFQKIICSFNDDIQGTAVVVLSSLLSAFQIQGKRWADQQIVIFGAGSSGIGIADHLVLAMEKEALSPTEARNKIWLINRQGLITERSEELTDFQKPYAKSADQVSSISLNYKNPISFADVVRQVKPTILIGVSSVAGAFTEEIIKTMAEGTEQPIILPLSNPIHKSEAKPQDLITWTRGRALIATGSPFPLATWKNRQFKIAQCNNAFVFPGIGLGAAAVKAKQITPAMLIAASEALAYFTSQQAEKTAILPSPEKIQEVSQLIAIAVAKQAIHDHMAEEKNIEHALRAIQWKPVYYPYQLKEIP